jgi:hypothetical protein
MTSETCARAAWRSKVSVTGPAARTPAEGPQSPDARQRARRRSPGEQSSTSGASISSRGGLRREWNGSRSGERGGEAGEDHKVGVKLHLLDLAHAERAESPFVLQAAELALDGSASLVEVAESLGGLPGRDCIGGVAGLGQRPLARVPR